jgi:transcriptional regulator with XRE-family HTH domain
MSRIAERLRALRGDEAQGAFAARLGLKQAVYCHYEKARREPSLDQLVSIAVTLDCTSDYLLGLSDEGPSEKDPSVTVGDINVHGSNNRISQVINPQKRKARR